MHVAQDHVHMHSMKYACNAASKALYTVALDRFSKQAIRVLPCLTLRLVFVKITACVMVSVS